MPTNSLSQLGTAKHIHGRSVRPTPALSVVVGFDGSESSKAALEVAIQLISGRNGALEVVYVAHLPASVLMSADALVGVRDGFASIASELQNSVRAALDASEQSGHFRRRDGSVGHELVAVARELRRLQGSDTTIVIVVGSSHQAIHHVVGSVAAMLTHEDEFPLLMVPPRKSDHRNY